MHLRAVFVSMILVAGCGKSKEGGDDKPAKGKTDRPTNKDVTSLFTGTAPSLPPEVAKASFDAKKADVLKAVGTDSGYLSSKTHADVSYDLRFTRADNLEQISVTTRGAPLEPILTKQWGAPIKASDGELYWFAPAAGLRAWLPDYGKGEVVAFSKYEPLATLLGPKGFDLAFAKDKALFGATLDELHAAWGAKLCDWERESATLKKSYEENVKDSLYPLDGSRLTLRLCPGWPRTVEGSPNSDIIYLGLDQKVFAIVMSFPTGGSPELAAQLDKELAAKFDSPQKATITGDDGTETWYFDPASKRRATVKVGKDYVTLGVGPYLPMAELIGDASTPGLAIETPSMIGGTADKIKAENPDHLRTAGTLYSLVFPPTEWSFWQTEVQLQFWDKDPKAYGYRTVLHYKMDTQEKDAYALLEAKYGAPKKTTGDDKDKTFSFAKGGRKLDARRVSSQWQLTVTK